MSDWLKEKTGKSSTYWMRRIGFLIGKHACKIKCSVHDGVERKDWMDDLFREVKKLAVDQGWIRRLEFPEQCDGDSNMVFASVMSFVLMQWYVRLMRAKGYDPRRPANRRRNGMASRRTRFCSEVMRFMVDERHDHQIYHKQKLDPPFVPGAKNGKYI